MKGQLSAEMLVLIVVVLAVIAIASTQMIGTAKETSGNIGEHTERLDRMTSEAVKSPEGGFCVEDEDCERGLGCDEYRCN